MLWILGFTVCNPQYLLCTPCGSRNSAPLGTDFSRETTRLSHCWLRDHGSLTPGTIPLRSLGVTALGRTSSRFNARPVTTQKYHYHFVPVIASLGLQSRFWLIPFIALSLWRKVLARSKSTWLGILTPTRVTYLVVCLFSCQCPRREMILSKLRSWNMCPFTKRDWERVFLGGGIAKKIKKVKKVDLESKRKVPFGT